MPTAINLTGGAYQPYARDDAGLRAAYNTDVARAYQSADTRFLDKKNARPGVGLLGHSSVAAQAGTALAEGLADAEMRRNTGQSENNAQNLKAATARSQYGMALQGLQNTMRASEQAAALPPGGGNGMNSAGMTVFQPTSLLKGLGPYVS